MTTPSKDRGDLIREHGERIATLNERIDNLRREVDRILTHQETTRQLHDGTDKQISLMAREIERLDKKMEELRSRRWALWQLTLAGFLTFVLAIGSGFVGKLLERLIPAATVRVK